MKRLLIVTVLFLFGFALIAAGPPDPKDDAKMDVEVPVDDNESNDNGEDEEPYGGYGVDSLELSIQGGLSRQSQAWCTVLLERPEQLGMDIEGGARMLCGGPISKIKLKMHLKRHVWGALWSTLDAWDSGWRFNTTELYNRLYGSCTSGTHTYRVWVKAWVVDLFGVGEVQSGWASERFTC